MGGMRLTAFDNREQVSVLDWARVNKAWPLAVPSKRRSMVLDLPRLWVLDAIHGWVQIKSLNGGEALSTGGGSTPIANQSWTDTLDAQESASPRQTPSHPQGGQLAISRISHGLTRFAPSACRHPASSPRRSKPISCLLTSKRPTKLSSRHLARPSSGGRIWWCTNNQEAPCPMARWTAGAAPANAQLSSLPNKAIAQDGFERVPLGSCQKGACDQIGTWELSFQPASGSCESLITTAIDGYGRRLSTTRAAKSCPPSKVSWVPADSRELTHCSFRLPTSSREDPDTSRGSSVVRGVGLILLILFCRRLYPKLMLGIDEGVACCWGPDRHSISPLL